MPQERLQKVLAHAGVASRRHAEEMILAGKVSVDGKVVKELGVKVDRAVNKITVNGKPLAKPQEFEYFIIHKPVGVVTTVSDTHDRKTVMDLLPSEVKNRLYPVGRLDQDSEGLVLMTNDGDMAYRLTQAKYKVPKIYKVWVKGYAGSQALKALRNGIELKDGMTAPARVYVKSANSHASKLNIVLHEGKKRQIRRMCGHVDLPVKRLLRVAIGSLKLGELPLGAARRLTAAEVKQLKLQLGKIGACNKR